MDSLRQKLESQGLADVNYMVVNHQGAQAQRLHSMLTSRLSASIGLFKQGDQDADVWQALNGEKDDFLIYDRCGRLTYHISLPYSIIGQGHIENAIRATYCTRICGDCSHEGVEVPEACSRPAGPAAREEDTASRAAEQGQQGHHHAHGHAHHAHGHHHGDRHHGRHGDDQQVVAVHQGHGREPEQSATGDAALLLLGGQQQVAAADLGLAQPGNAQSGQVVLRRP